MSEVIGSTLALIADIHGNVWALNAVLEDIQRRNIQRIINLGDSLLGPLAPAETADRLMSLAIITISGNGDRMLHSPTSSEQASASYRFTKNRLKPEHIEWLRQLPSSCVSGDLFCCHGTPESDHQPLLEEITDCGVFLASSERILSYLSLFDR